MTSRRTALRVLIAMGAGIPSRAAATQGGRIIDTSNFAVMDQSSALPVRRPAKPGALSVVSAESVNALERELRCQCACTLDVYTCRTTDPVCQVAPAMHRDVLILAQGGHTADEIREAFADVYGESVLLAPPARGFTLLAYALPAIVTLAAAVTLTVVLRRRAGPAV